MMYSVFMHLFYGIVVTYQKKLEYYSLKNDLENEITFLSVHVYCVKFKKKAFAFT